MRLRIKRTTKRRESLTPASQENLSQRRRTTRDFRQNVTSAVLIKFPIIPSRMGIVSLNCIRTNIFQVRKTTNKKLFRVVVETS